MGKWVNPDGFTLVPLIDRPGIWIARLDLSDPLAWQADDGRRIQPDRYELTDLGSIPRLLWPMVPPTRCPRTWLMHDCGYTHGGLYVSAYLNAPFRFAPMTRLEIDDLMWNGMLAEGLNVVACWIVYRAVRTFGWLAWRDKPKTRVVLRALKAWVGSAWPGLDRR